jgi:hypothetical protein
MGQIIPAEMLERMRPMVEALAQVALAEARPMTLIADGADEEATAAAIAVNAVNLAITALVQVIPLSDLGMAVALASVYGTLLGCADEHRGKLHEAFQAQTNATMAEIRAARMIPMGNA